MSVEAITWALSTKLERSSTKFVLVAMANCANSDMTCWPSIPYLSDATSQDRKTVLENIKRLQVMGYIEDTGERKGSTKQVPVYRLCEPKNSAENGTVKESQKRNSTENGTVPKTDGNSTVFPGKESRFSLETVPKTGHGTVKEPSGEPSGNRHKGAGLPVFALPDWIPEKAWNGYLEMRKKKRKEPTEHARDLVIAELLKLKTAGQNIEDVLNQSTRNGWTDVYAVKGSHIQQPATAGPSKLGKAGQATAAAAQRLLEKARREHGQEG